jgi:hypothetical protein
MAGDVGERCRIAHMTRLLLVSTALVLAACATDSTVATERPSDKEYRTGSRIPVRPGGPPVGDVRTIGREQIERAGSTDINTSGTPGGTPR